MTHDVADKDGDPALGPKSPGSDPQLASIYELSRLMTLPPKDLIARINVKAATARVAELRSQDHSESDLGRGAPASLASLVTAEAPTPRAGPPALPRAGRSHRGDAATIETNVEDRHRDDEQVPALSTRHAPPVAHADNARFLQRIFAALLAVSFGLGLLLTTVLWLDGWLDDAPKVNEHATVTAAGDVRARPARIPVATADKSVTPTQPDVASVETRTMGEAAGHSTDIVAESRDTVAEPPPQAEKALEEAVRRSEQVVEEARRRIERGDVARARDLLAAVEDDPKGLVSYALAETYDPNMLAAWGARGVVADVGKARALYAEALDLGVARARQRLDALR